MSNWIPKGDFSSRRSKFGDCMDVLKILQTFILEKVRLDIPITYYLLILKMLFKKNLF